MRKLLNTKKQHILSLMGLRRVERKTVALFV